MELRSTSSVGAVILRLFGRGLSVSAATQALEKFNNSLLAALE